MTEIQRVVVWRRLDGASMEYCTLSRLADGWQLSGTVVAVESGRPLRVNYAVTCDGGWRTQLVNLTVRNEDGDRALVLRPTDTGTWLVDEEPVPGVTGCVDIDLGITPATNTLPIRRLNLAVGEGADVVATWVVFPSLTIKPLHQRYTRIAERRYRYESDTGFEADIDVDPDGIVTTYPGGWTQLE